MPAEGNSFVTAEPGSGDKLSDRLNHLAAALFKFTQDRLDLLRWEAAQEGARVGAMLVYGFCAALLAFLALEVLAVLVISIFWDTVLRIPVIVAFFVGAAVGTVFMYRGYRAKRIERSALLHENQIFGS